MTADEIRIARQISVNTVVVNPGVNVVLVALPPNANRVAVTLAVLGNTFGALGAGAELGYVKGGTFVPVLGVTAATTSRHATIATHGQFVQGELAVRNTSAGVNTNPNVTEYVLEGGAGV